ncbi:MAG TPA: four helix bundle protein [Spirochaetota bacterium]|nr:four helix bundle protein [Spirochaetota bacterium]
MSELKLYQKSYDFMLWLFNKTDGFPKSKRFSVGQRIENTMLEFVIMLNNLQYSKPNRRELYMLSVKFDEVKLLVKISYDAKLIAKNSFAYAVERCDEIGSMLGGYIKSAG